MIDYFLTYNASHQRPGFAGAVCMRLLVVNLVKQINIGAFYQLRIINSELT